jgi:hypothetical protein
VKNLGHQNSVTASTRTGLGAFFSLTSILLVLAIILSTSLSYGIDNNWAVVSLIISNNQVNIEMDWQVIINLYPSNLCNDPNLSIVGPLPLQNITNNNEHCIITWSCDHCYLDPSYFSFYSGLWSSYLYHIGYEVSVKSDMSSTLSGYISINSSNTIFKGNVGQINIITTPSLLLDGSNTKRGVIFQEGNETPLLEVSDNQFLNNNGIGFRIDLSFTEYWQQVYIQSKQSEVEFLAQTFALCTTTITFIRLIMYAIARKIYIRSNKPDIDLSIRKSTVKEGVEPEIGDKV